MNVGHLLTVPCTITTVTEDPDDPDEYGNPGKVETTATTVCWFTADGRGSGADGGTERTGLDDKQIESWALYLPADTTIAGHDKVTILGVVYEVSGPPWPAVNPRTGVTEFVEARIGRTT